MSNSNLAILEQSLLSHVSCLEHLSLRIAFATYDAIEQKTTADMYYGMVLSHLKSAMSMRPFNLIF